MVRTYAVSDFAAECAAPGGGGAAATTGGKFSEAAKAAAGKALNFTK